ncbi:hypothetical protein F8F33_23480 [Salmonella enterica]|nr:hypothetical protein [Salmonella enterica]
MRQPGDENLWIRVAAGIYLSCDIAHIYRGHFRIGAHGSACRGALQYGPCGVCALRRVVDVVREPADDSTAIRVCINSME